MSLLTSSIGVFASSVLAASFLIAPVSTQGPGVAQDDLSQDLPVTVEVLSESLQQGVLEGDPIAEQSLDALANLTEAELDEFEEILAGEGIFAAAENEVDGVDVETVEEPADQSIEGAEYSGASFVPAGFTAVPAATTTRTRTCTSSFKFLGITVTSVQLSGTYRTNAGRVVGTSGVSARTVRSYEPGVSISYSNNQRSHTSTRANFRSTVTVTRNIFGINHSTRSGILKMSADGSGSVRSCGF